MGVLVVVVFVIRSSQWIATSADGRPLLLDVASLRAQHAAPYVRVGYAQKLNPRVGTGHAVSVAAFIRDTSLMLCSCQ